MNDRERILKESRQNEQNNQLKIVGDRFFNHFHNKDFSMKIEISLDNYLPEYHLKYDSNTIFNFLNDNLKSYVIYINSYQCYLYEEIERDDDGWICLSNNNYGGSIFIKEDGIVLYNWHYDFNHRDEHTFESTLMSTYLFLLLNFLPSFYEKINYSNRINFKLDFKGIKECIFYPRGPERIRKVYKENCKYPINKIFSLTTLSNKKNIIQIVCEIFSYILINCFDYSNYNYPKELNNF